MAKERQAGRKAVPQSIEEIEEDPDIGLSDAMLPEPFLALPDPVDPLFVQKPIGPHEPT